VLAPSVGAAPFLSKLVKLQDEITKRRERLTFWPFEMDVVVVPSRTSKGDRGDDGMT